MPAQACVNTEHAYINSEHANICLRQHATSYINSKKPTNAYINKDMPTSSQNKCTYTNIKTAYI